jgi:hypothetical protein
MAALMQWVENGNAPTVIIGEKFDAKTNSVTIDTPDLCLPVGDFL